MAYQLMNDEEKANAVEQRLRSVEQQLFSLELDGLDPRQGADVAQNAKQQKADLEKFAAKLSDRLGQLRPQAAAGK